MTERDDRIGKGGENFAALFLHEGELLFGVSLALFVTDVVQLPTIFPTITTEIFAVVMEVAFVVTNVAPVCMHIPPVMADVATIGP